MAKAIKMEFDHQVRVLKVMDKPSKAQHLILRLLANRYRNQFIQFAKLKTTPAVFIHGNPHVDNYARTLTGAGMIDFDRSRIGPYSWDIVRFLSSLSLKTQEGDDNQLLSRKVLSRFSESYLTAYNSPEIYYSIPPFLKSIVPKPEELTTNAYLKANIKWAKRMRKTPIDINDPWINQALRLYLESRNEVSLLVDYEPAEAGQSKGSMGKMHYLIALKPKDVSSGRDDILIDLKETYTDPDEEWFKTPDEHHGVRMIKASNLYAPGVEQKMGHFTIEKAQFWGREVPAFKAKVKGLLAEEELQDLAHAVGLQLGRGHRRSNRAPKISKLEKHFIKNFDFFLDFSFKVKSEIKDYFESLKSSICDSDKQKKIS